MFKLSLKETVMLSLTSSLILVNKYSLQKEISLPITIKEDVLRFLKPKAMFSNNIRFFFSCLESLNNVGKFMSLFNLVVAFLKLY